ncbi:helix-turn-helix transcriptional regulator [Jannaschia sp. LMIT008]|uniref:helix-turn-helix transcriptional regulator n=1 Tax=Jannaschia maritima TaxID=3032585 RepID=UPI002811DAEE|nr:autoinducer binding domain-containing protein [Jannaschia sp. LMIT008]
MSARLEQFLGRLSDAATVDDAKAAVLSAVSDFGVEHLVFHAALPNGEQVSAFTYRPDWVETYVEQDFFRVDPVVLGCYGGFAPLDWKRLDWSKKAARVVMAESVAHGVGTQGYTVPMRGPGGQHAVLTMNATMSDDAWARFTGEVKNDMLLAAHYANEKIIALTTPAHAASQALSPRESDALTYLAKGQSRGQAAEQLKISEHTLRAYIESARFKLGAANVTHAVASALSRGLICP